ncbi:caseinolytic peptidase B protein homolog, partial [Trichonephila clavata]
ILRLVKKGVDVNKRHRYGWTSLQVAAMNGNLSVLELLLKSDADPDLGDNFSSVYKIAKEKRAHPLKVWSAREKEFSERLNTAALFSNCTALHYAVATDEIEAVEILLKHGANPQSYAIKYEQKQEEIEAEARRRFPLDKELKVYCCQEGAIANVSA